ncbi:hypothetical protein GW17_00001551 [Ensete ventricosum]|nr:hypothetical protein GW17_00001551 [Ensete ventricosum]
MMKSRSFTASKFLPDELVSNDCQEISDTEPILPKRTAAGSSHELTSSSEIRPVLSDCDQNVDDDIDDERRNLVNQDPPQCRICLDIGDFPTGDDLIAPCYCRGTQKYVHRSCLDNWRSTKEGFAFAHCTECRAVFLLRANVPPDRWWLRLKFQLLVARDHVLIFVIVQLVKYSNIKLASYRKVVAFLGMLVYRFYGEELREMFGYEEHPYGFYTMASKFPFANSV